MRRRTAEARVRCLFDNIGFREVYGLDIAKITGLGPGRLYPTLARLEAQGDLSSRWDGDDEGYELTDYPRRRLYRKALR